MRNHPECRYIFLSSGAAYGVNFGAPVDEKSLAHVGINNLQPQDWYGVAKLHAECRHRALAPLPIVDIRVFNYFSHAQDMNARFLISDVLRAIRDKTVLRTSKDYIVRDYLHPSDFFQLVNVMLSTASTNTVIDCYSLAPIDKPTLLTIMQENFGLQYELLDAVENINNVGKKINYHSLSKKAAEFGYSPKFTSIECLLIELRKYFK